MAQRISRAKQSIKTSRVPFRMPDADERAQPAGLGAARALPDLQRGLHHSSGHALQRTDLSNEAIRLTRAVHALLPDDGEVAGLLALMLLTDARRAARTGPGGELIPLDEQDRTLWDAQAIAEGVALVERGAAPGIGRRISAAGGDRGRARRGGARRGHRLAADPRALQRAEADVRQPDGRAQPRHRHGDGPRSERRARSADTARSGRAAAPATIGWTPCARTCWRRAGEREAAVSLYRTAAEKTTSVPERNYLLMRAARLSEAP